MHFRLRHSALAAAAVAAACVLALATRMRSSCLTSQAMTCAAAGDFDASYCAGLDSRSCRLIDRRPRNGMGHYRPARAPTTAIRFLLHSRVAADEVVAVVVVAAAFETSDGGS